MDSLLEVCKSTLREDDTKGHQLLQKVNRLFEKANTTFTTSDSFLIRVAELADKVRQEPKRMWIITKDLFQDLRAYKQKAIATHTSAEERPESVSLDTQSNGSLEVTSKKKASEHQLNRLEALLAAHHKKIDELENAELTLDDLDKEDNSYLLASRLKKRAAKIFRRICELKDRSIGMGGIREKKFRYSGSRYSEINRTVERFVNRHSVEEKMPDFQDIRKIIGKCNVKFDYHLSNQRINDLAKDVFTEVGNSISKLRKEDFVQDFGPSSSARVFREPADDPSQFSSKLRERLQENKSLADKKMKDVITKYATLQESQQEDQDDKEKKGDGEDETDGEETGSSESEEEINTEDDTIISTPTLSLATLDEDAEGESTADCSEVSHTHTEDDSNDASLSSSSSETEAADDEGGSGLDVSDTDGEESEDDDQEPARKCRKVEDKCSPEVIVLSSSDSESS